SMTPVARIPAMATLRFFALAAPRKGDGLGVGDPCTPPDTLEPLYVGYGADDVGSDPVELDVAAVVGNGTLVPTDGAADDTTTERMVGMWEVSTSVEEA
ncbi:MAG: hypothetical protein Q9163_005586, partial [Psora crenata]